MTAPNAWDDVCDECYVLLSSRVTNPDDLEYYTHLHLLP